MNDAPTPTIASEAASPAGDAATAVGARLRDLFAAIGERSMRDLPVYNPALAVEAIGFRASAGRAVGIVATPWFMNLVVTDLPGGAVLPPATAGANVVHRLPGGDFPCVVGHLDGFGRFDGASLFSPMFEFDDPAVVRAVAEAAIEEIFTVPPVEPPVEPKAAAPAAIDRRALLFGRRGGEDATCR